MRSIWLVSLMLFAGLASAAELTARLDRAQISDAETVMLSLVLSGDASGTPDLSPLAADFDLIDQSHTSRMSFINGVSSRSQEWRLELAPRRTGELTIPALTVGSLASEPMTLEVLDAATAPGARTDQQVFLDVSATPESPYVQGRIDYRVRLYARVRLLQPRLSDPEAEGALVQRVGEDVQTSELVDGERYTVIERRYAIFPQRSGALEIVPPRLVADVPVERAAQPDLGFGQDPFAPIGDVFGTAPGLGGLFNATRQVRARGEPVTIDVRPQPASAATPWLPAESVQLSDEWAPASVSVGEALTRTLTITAAGVMSAQLPDLELTAPPDVKLYPDPARVEDGLRGDVPIAVKELKVALVPTEPGEVTLPEIRLSWWDTQTDEPREAVVAARTLDVTGAAGPAAPSAASSEEAMAPAVAAEEGSLGGLSRERLIGWGFAAGWLATIGLWWSDRRRWRAASAAAAKEPAPERRPRLTLNDARLAVERACRHRGPRDARDALLDWGALAWPDNPPRGLAGLAARMDSDEAAEALTALERSLYSETGPTDWDGLATWAALAPALRANAHNDDEAASDLPELYPRTD